MPIDYGNFRRSLKNLETQHEYLLHHTSAYPLFVQEGMAESVIQRFETCYDALWKVLRRHLVEALGIAEVPSSPRVIFRTADESQLLAAGGAQWQLYVQTRIDTTHDYDGEKAANAIALMPEFIADAIDLYSAMTGERWE
ncbi:MAG: nucleotidyltransferase substrate binding protein [Chloroflexota bacterium]|nr:nucleotidyltransferase substrate binding protein [Chloroflexota bacterium]